MRRQNSIVQPRHARAIATTLFSAIALGLTSMTGFASLAHASFHLIEINKILPSFDGNTSIQAVELRMITSGETFLSGLSIRSYDGSGAVIATLGTFPGAVANGVPDRKVLCATAGFASQFGITPDLVITAGVPVGTGQISFETVGCLVNAVAYGDVATPINGATVAPAIPVGLAYVLDRKVQNTIIPSCPLAEDAGARFAVVSGSSSSPVPFSNNSGTTVDVFSALTAVEAPPPAPKWRVYPNPFSDALRIEAPSTGPVTVFDAGGRLVRRLFGDKVRVLAWDGRNTYGTRVPAGVYFVSFGTGAERLVARVVVLQ